ncbi:hypothetical protein [Niabella hirudinis]|uniref:hypothetical protein n=1 Tax=Niabella hirudinis TaxID=1285929 RepID=UPI003EC15045
MKKLSILFAAVVAVAVLSVSWKATTNEGATNVKVPYSGDLWSPCTNEMIHLEGDLHLLTNMTTNDNRMSVKYQLQSQGISGMGSISGNKYNANGIAKASMNGSLVNGSYTNTINANFNLVSQGSGDNLSVHILLHITVNANGDVTATVENISMDCK